MLPRLLRLAVTSGVATIVDTAVLVAACSLAGAPPSIGAIAGGLVGGTVNFAIGRTWVFGARGAWLAQAARYFALVVACGALVTGAAVAALAAGGLPLVACKAIAVPVVLVTWTYPVTSRFVYAPQARPRTSAVARLHSGPRVRANEDLQLASLLLLVAACTNSSSRSCSRPSRR